MSYVLVTLKLLIAFIILISYLHISGKQQISQMNTIDFIGNFIFGSAVGGTIYASIPFSQYIITLLLVVTIVYSLNFLSKKVLFFKEKSIGHSIPIIRDGKILIDTIKNKKFQIDILNIASQLRLKGICSFSEVNYAQIEPGGELTVITDKNLSSAWILVKEGKIMIYELKEIGKDTKWLEKEIKNKGVKNISDIFLAEYWKGKLSIILQNGKIII